MLRRLLTSTLVLLLLTPASAFAAGTWRWPVRGEVITSYRNGDDPYAAGQHRGIDIAGAVGDPVVAAVGGEVRYAGALGSSGTVVSVRTGDGAYDTSYLHLSSVAVARGQRVAGGDRLGAVGTTGERSAAASHLHFGVREAGQRQAYLDPLGLLGPIGIGGESPLAAPAPQAAPVPVVAPRAVGAVPRRVPVRAPSGAVRAPAARRARSPLRAPVPVPGGAARRGVVRGQAHRVPDVSPGRGARPAGVRMGAPSFASGAHRRNAGAARDRPAADRVRQPGMGPTSSLGPAVKPDRPAVTASQSSPRAEATGGGGPDLGLVLAGLSLLAAAVGLGLRGRDGGQTRRRGAYRVNRARSRPAHQP